MPRKVCTFARRRDTLTIDAYDQIHLKEDKDDCHGILRWQFQVSISHYSYFIQFFFLSAMIEPRFFNSAYGVRFSYR
jgi:hypothetical protein